VDEFIIKSISGQVYYKIYKVDELKLFPQVDEFVVKSISGQVYHKVHKVDELKLLKSTSGRARY